MEANTTISMEPVRHLANFPPSIWGDQFLYFSIDNSELEAHAQAMEEPKEEVRRLIINQTIDSNAKLSLIYSVYRLGLTYLFSEEIDGQLDKLFNEFSLKHWDEADLYTTSINFQVFRHFGYKLSCDVFNKFKDHRSGTFEEYINIDVRGMLSFYECAHFGINGEFILDEALTFTKAQLKRVVNGLEGNLAQQVKHVLMRSFHRGMPMVEARLYFTNYKEECSAYNSLRKLGNAHFNYLQLLQKKELSVISKWWKEMEFKTLTPYVRERVPELYLWILALFFEPRCSEARIITTKIIILVLVLDDTCDAYATIQEIRLLTHAINRWEFTAMEQLPEYIKPFYKILLNEYAEFEKQDGRQHIVNASKQAFQEQARGYLIEAEWTHSGEVPSFEEYMKNGLTTSTHNILSKSALIGMGEIVTEEALAWHQSHPKILKDSELISRLHDDVMTFQFERERGQSTTGVDAYMKTFGVSENVAIDELMKMIENAWKDINEGCLKPREVSMDILAPILNLARMIDVAYKHNDGFTFPEKTLKEYITLLFVDPAPMY